MTSPAGPALAPLARQYAVLLTTHKRDGTSVGTPVSIAVDGDHAYIRTYASSGKAKRMRNFPEVEIAPSTLRGTPTGPALSAQVRLLGQGSPECKRAARLLRRKHPVMHGIGVPLAHRLMRDKTLHYEVRVTGTS
ncbi:PPOX class F420-dependent oxidoreductase [Streptomyces beijiangensis]|uniref:PPOX class F420-dependent oxidoreductase n=1 Tax=Streptomyces beijiangensis TaxID=163361 RepID=A0A939F3J4_9ACTN|nr:PPOX class F420-dependent oxidoreductase [Streptomyces beijiangensis]MBO0510764.1 PPOX class F420-dependent oxidoreductase [Streptomyces beijiangensis]